MLEIIVTLSAGFILLVVLVMLTVLAVRIEKRGPKPDKDADFRRLLGEAESYALRPYVTVLQEVRPEPRGTIIVRTTGDALNRLVYVEAIHRQVDRIFREIRRYEAGGAEPTAAASIELSSPDVHAGVDAWTIGELEDRGPCVTLHDDTGRILKFRLSAEEVRIHA